MDVAVKENMAHSDVTCAADAARDDATSLDLDYDMSNDVSNQTLDDLFTRNAAR